jgi:hypothetical protein
VTAAASGCAPNPRAGTVLIRILLADDQVLNRSSIRAQLVVFAYGAVPVTARPRVPSGP